jgi:hypothetical protein
MLMTRRRSTVAAAATLFTVLASAAFGQEVDDKAPVLVEPDFRVGQPAVHAEAPATGVELSTHAPLQRQPAARQFW